MLEMYGLMSSQWSILGDDHFGFSVRRQRASVCVVSVGLRRQLVASHFRRVCGWVGGWVGLVWVCEFARGCVFIHLKHRRASPLTTGSPFRPDL